MSNSKPQIQFPTKQDFDPWNGQLDALNAWRNFGGLDVAAAYQKFIENPLCYQEDFMFMGPQAFDFYFPVIDRYLREVRITDPLDSTDCEAWILGKSICSQIKETTARMDSARLLQLSSLTAYVLEHLAQYANEPRDQKRVHKSWKSVERALEPKSSASTAISK